MEVRNDVREAGTVGWRDVGYRGRGAALAAFGLTGVLFAVASFLSPDARGLGTHEQLGLGACTMLKFFHIPCAFCGMTTTFSLMIRGEFLAGFMTQPAGAILFMLTTATCLGSLGVMATGKMPARLGVHYINGRVALIALGVLLVAWGYKITVHLT